MTTPAAPPPGSPEAIAAGCTCPVIDNHYGAGRVVGRNADGTKRSVWWYSADCPVHNPQTVEADKERQS